MVGDLCCNIAGGDGLAPGAPVAQGMLSARPSSPWAMS